MAPYGMRGGDTKESDQWMEKCVMEVQKSGKDKGSAVAICKATWDKKHGDAKACYDILNKGIVEEYNKLIGDN